MQISDPNLQGRLGKECLQDCVQDRYSLSQSFSDFSDNLKADLVSKINAAGAPTSTTNIVILKFYLNSLEFNKIHNFPQHGLQFVAEVSLVISCFSMHFPKFPTHDFEKKNPLFKFWQHRYSHVDFLCNRKHRNFLNLTSPSMMNRWIEEGELFQCTIFQENDFLSFLWFTIHRPTHTNLDFVIFEETEK